MNDILLPQPPQALGAKVQTDPCSFGHTNHSTTGAALLIVDDDPALTDLICKLAERVGYQAVAAHSGEVGLILHAAYPGGFAMVITDLDMPGMGGAGMIEELQRREPQIRLLVVSANCSEIEEERLLRRGVRGIVRKPFRLAQLCQQIHCALV